MKLFRFLAMAAVAAGTLFLASCSDGSGGGGGGGGGSTSTIQGSAVKGPVNAATVTVKRADTGGTLGTTTTDSNGNYSFTTTFAGLVVVEISGGTYTDEATGQTATLASPMRTVLTTTSSGGEVFGVVTPLTTMAYQIASANGTTAVSSAAFTSAAGTLATQFGLGQVNLITTVPSVTGTVNAYGNALRALSQYMSTNTQTFADFASSFTVTTAYFSSFGPAYQAAFSSINDGQTITVAFDSTGFTIGGTGAGGGSGTCGIHVQGSVTTMNITVPLNLDYCVQGIAQGSCTSGNSSLSQALSGQSGLAGGVNLQYSYSASCAGGAINITLQ